MSSDPFSALNVDWFLTYSLWEPNEILEERDLNPLDAKGDSREFDALLNRALLTTPESLKNSSHN